MAYQGDRTFTEVIQDIIGNVQAIIRSEIRLAKTEVKEEATKAGRATAILATGSILGLYAGGFLLLTIARALEIVMAPWLATLIVAVLAGAGAAFAIKIGRTRMNYVHPTPNKTIQTMKENIEWARDQTR